MKMPKHYHCPHDCEKPHPTKVSDGRILCLRCNVEGRGYVEMFLCTPDICDEAGTE